MPSFPFAPDAVGMCPATLLTPPRSFDAASIDRVVHASAAAGFPSMSLWLTYVRLIGIDATRALIDDAGIAVRAVEAVSLWADGPTVALEEAEQVLDFAGALGADLVLAARMDPIPDLGAATDSFAAVCERAARRGARVAIEFIPCSGVPDLATAWQIVRDSGAENGGILLDFMHWQHQPGGPNLELLRTIPGRHIPYVQVCDARAERISNDEYLAVALGGRPAPGDGVVDIDAVLGTLAEIGADPYFAYEVFNAELASKGAEAMASHLRANALTLFD
jgi:sugar phosphate isomerase/epimerase